MANVKLQIGGREYDVSCADGDEPHLEKLAAIVDDKVEQARHVVGDVNEARQLLFAAIFMADELLSTNSAQNAAPQAAPTPSLAPYIQQLVAQIDRITQKIG